MSGIFKSLKSLGKKKPETSPAKQTVSSATVKTQDAKAESKGSGSHAKVTASKPAGTASAPVAKPKESGSKGQAAAKEDLEESETKTDSPRDAKAPSSASGASSTAPASSGPAAPPAVRLIVSFELTCCAVSPLLFAAVAIHADVCCVRLCVCLCVCVAVQCNAAAVIKERSIKAGTQFSGHAGHRQTGAVHSETTGTRVALHLHALCALPACRLLAPVSRLSFALSFDVCDNAAMFNNVRVGRRGQSEGRASQRSEATAAARAR